MQKFFTLNDLDVKGKRVLVRVDFNVPLNKKTDKLNDCVGDYVKGEVMKMKEGNVTLLENLRFHPEEEENDEGFSRQLADLAELYVNDAFGTCHRAHASTYGAAQYLKSAAGFLVEKEIKIIGKAMETPDRPFVAILGGVKVSDKIKVIESLLAKVDKLLLGGAMIFTFYKAQGKNVGSSKVDEDGIEFEKFAKGTKEIAKFLSELRATTIIGGGDSAAAVEKFGYASKLTHVSTGGGASLEFFEGKKLPGIEALENSYRKFK